MSAAAMQAMLGEFSQIVAPNVHAVVLMDCARWHIAEELAVPANLTLSLPAEPARRGIARAGQTAPKR